MRARRGRLGGPSTSMCHIRLSPVPPTPAPSTTTPSCTGSSSTPSSSQRHSPRPASPMPFARYIAGQSEANHRAYTKPWQAASPDVRTTGSCDPSRSSAQSPQRRVASNLGPRASRGYYEAYLPLGHVADAMFAPCLLGCRGTARQRPVPRGTGARGLPYSPAGNSIMRHQEVFSNTLSSGLLIRGFGVQVPGGAPVLTWGYARSGLPREGRFGAMFAARLLTSPDIVYHGARNARRGPYRWLYTA